MSMHTHQFNPGDRVMIKLYMGAHTIVPHRSVFFYSARLKDIVSNFPMHTGQLIMIIGGDEFSVTGLLAFGAVRGVAATDTLVLQLKSRETVSDQVVSAVDSARLEVTEVWSFDAGEKCCAGVRPANLKRSLIDCDEKLSEDVAPIHQPPRPLQPRHVPEFQPQHFQTIRIDIDAMVKKASRKIYRAETSLVSELRQQAAAIVKIAQEDAAAIVEDARGGGE